MNARVELRWFFDEAEGELGLRGVDYQPRGNGGIAPDEAAERQARSAARYAEVRRRLEPLSPEDRRVLFLAFGPHVWPKLERWYELAGVAAWIVDREDVVQAGQRVALLDLFTAAPQLRARAKHVLAMAEKRFDSRAPVVDDLPMPPKPQVPRLKRARAPLVVPEPSRAACTCMSQWEEGPIEQLDLPDGATAGTYQALRASLPAALRFRLSAAVESTDGRLHFRAGRACSSCWRRDNLPWGA